MGTRIYNVRLTEVVDGDTLKVQVNGDDGEFPETLRLLGIDTEESAIGSKPVTNAGLEASRRAKEYFNCDEQGFPTTETLVDLEFDSVEPEHVCLQQHRGYYGRLLCYVHKDGENYNLKMVREGLSPYFVKYGRSRLYHKDFLLAEAEAQSAERMIWDPATNQGGNSRNYATLIPWWHLRDSVVADHRSRGLQAGVLTVQKDLDDILVAAEMESTITVLCDLVNGVSEEYPGSGALIEAGTSSRQFNLWIPAHSSAEAESIRCLIEKRYAGEGGRGYVFVSGTASMYDGKPEIVLYNVAQLSDIPPGDGASL